MGLKKIKPEGRFSWLNYLSDRGGVGYIRSILPNLILGAWRYKKITFDPCELTSFIPLPEFYKSKSFVKFQRSATKEQLEMIKYFKTNISSQTKTYTIYEIDDLVVSYKDEYIPEWNFASDYYKKNEKHIKEMLKIVDGITVSTPYLKGALKKYNKNISVVPNRLAKCLWGDIKECDPVIKGNKPKILYPGSQNHFGIKDRTTEGGDFGKELLNYIQKTKDIYEWIFVGGVPDELKNDDKITYHKWLDYISYPMFMKNLDVDISLAPLEINEFNRCKSNLKSLEYTVMGLPSTYTNIEPYRKTSLRADNDEHMIEQIEWLLQSEDNRYNTWKKDKESISSGLFLEGNRKQWINEHLRLFNFILK